MVKSSTIKPELPDLPSLEERIPEALAKARAIIHGLNANPPQPILLCLWQELYAVFHSLKGLTKILRSTPPLVDNVVGICECLASIAHGSALPGANSTQLLRTCLSALEKNSVADSALADLAASFSRCPSHADRLREIPKILTQPSESISKLAWVTSQENWRSITVEEEILLGEFPKWNERAHAITKAFTSRFPACLVHVAPQLQLGDGHTVHAIAWAACEPTGLVDLEASLRSEYPNSRVQRR